MKMLSRIVLIWLLLLLLVATVRMLSPEPLVAPDALADAMGQRFDTPPPGIIGSATGFSLLLLGAWLTGVIFHRLHLPRIVGYLLFGVLVGPNLVGVLNLDIPPLVPEEQLTYLNLINAIAISLIALTAGGEIRLSFLRDRFMQILAITLGLIVCGFAMVAGALVLLHEMIPMLDVDAPDVRIILILLIATLALAGSPAVVIAMLSENRAHGPMSRTAISVVVLLDVCLIIIFTIVVTTALNVLPPPGEASGTAEMMYQNGDERPLLGPLAWHLIGSMVSGLVLGAVLAPLIPRIGQRLPIFVIGLSLGIALLSVAADLEALLVALTAGFVLANRWPGQSTPLFRTIEELSVPVYCVFFAVAGARLDLEAVIELWPIAMVIVFVRLAGLGIGSWIGATMTQLEQAARRWVWTAFIPQAGVSVALIATLESTFREYDWSVPLASLLLALVAIHELAGPILMRIGLVRSGEVGVLR